LYVWRIFHRWNKNNITPICRL